MPHPSLSLWPPSTVSNEESNELETEYDFQVVSSNSEVISLGLEDTLEQGEHLLYIDLPVEEHIQTTGTVSQHLVEASWKHKKAEVEIPEYLLEFEDVFFKELFHLRNHGIVPGSKPTNCKVYPLSPREQTELDAFLEENLCTGKIHPYKSPMASLVFFIKKKDGSLQLVQDYWALNLL